jgi:hypothetical protein
MIVFIFIAPLHACGQFEKAKGRKKQRCKNNNKKSEQRVRTVARSFWFQPFSLRAARMRLPTAAGTRSTGDVGETENISKKEQI